MLYLIFELVRDGWRAIPSRAQFGDVVRLDFAGRSSSYGVLEVLELDHTSLGDASVAMEKGHLLKTNEEWMMPTGRTRLQTVSESKAPLVRNVTGT
jgi:hypothetical protein